VPQASPRGTYAQIAEALRQQIEGGEYEEGLPSETELRRTYGVGRTTVGRALNALKADGLIESQQGAGWYVVGTGDRRPLVERITEMLRAEGMTVGDPFPSENALCEKFGVSRTAVRAAVAQLEGRGLVAMGAGRRREVRALPGEKREP
jgi:DNA-binding GntR family transcriptional regulator